MVHSKTLSFLDHECPDKTQSCADDSTCCPFGSDGDYGCCKTTNVPGNTCCGGGCCTDFETCCADDQGYTCCSQQLSYCVPKKDQTFPARCCPRWTVGCETGSVGCCDPAQPWQWELNARAHHAADLFSSTSTRSVVAVDAVAYALVVRGSAKEGAALSAWTIDTKTGKVTEKHTVSSSFDDDPFGESTREFLWDGKRQVFYYLDANFTANGGPRPATGRPVYLYEIDPTNGNATKRAVSGARDFPTGYAMRDSDGAIVMACEDWTNDGVEWSGFAFFSLNPETATATKLVTVPRGSDESSSASYYAGYHRLLTADGNSAVRVGYKSVSMQSEQGVSVAALNDAQSTQWIDELSPGHDYYMTATRVRGSDAILSLAPTTSSAHGLDVVRWSVSNTSAFDVLATLGNAHPPRTISGGVLGYLAADARDDVYAALVVKENNLLPDGIGDRLAIVVGSLADNGAFDVLPLEPRDIAGTLSVVGLGLASS